MPDTTTVGAAAGGGRRMRSDARLNRTRLLEAARQLLVEHGPEVPLDRIASRAGVSIATFYRHFADRTALLTTIVVAESETILDDLAVLLELVEAGPTRERWQTAMHDLVVAAHSRLTPVLAALNSGLLPIDHDIARLHTRLDDRSRALIEAATRRGLVRADTDHREVMALLAHAAHPAPHLSVAATQHLASRTIHVLLAGLHPDAADASLPGSPFRPPTPHP